jgi:transcription initiation factor TFIIH subunit 4
MLSHVGLVYIAHHSDDDIHFYNTNTMMNLLSHTSLPSSSSSLSEKSSSLSRVIPITHETTLSSSSLQIVVETNMQVIAYLTNDLHISILNLFIEVILRMPNMIIGRITRDKVKKAYKIGLSSDQIIHFLVSHSHPIVKSKSNDTSQLSHDFLVIPENVIDQLKLWEAENHRIISNDAIVFCFNDIPNLSSSQYHDIITYMKRFESYILYMNESQRILAVTLDGAEQLQSYVQETMSGYIF